MSAKDLLLEIIKVSEKAANIARLCRKDEHLFGLLIQEKPKPQGIQALTARFEHDFKTLADCLIQETVRYDIGRKFPDLKENIRGEEVPTFTNKLGESIVVEVTDNPEEITESLEKVLNGDKEAAKLLAEEVYREVVPDLESLIIPEDSIPLGYEWADLGVWIDPIDATQEYIKGECKPSKFPNIMASGLKCVAVLVGVYEVTTGTPIIGVVNQPFDTQLDGGGYEGRTYWGVAINDYKFNNISIPHENEKKIALLSPSEASKYQDFIKYKLNYDIVFSTGAGYKILKVITGEVDLFLLSKGTAYKWDTCGPQAILRSLGGDLFSLQDTLVNKTLKKISYEDRRIIRNTSGIIAYRDIDKFKEFLKL